ncbi:MAG: hypothetical protein ACTIL0_12125, partial [Microbacterium gubbeenense]
MRCTIRGATASARSRPDRSRSIQIVAIVVLAAGLIWGLQTLTVVVIPVVLAIVFASAFEPVMKWLRA